LFAAYYNRLCEIVTVVFRYVVKIDENFQTAKAADFHIHWPISFGIVLGDSNSITVLLHVSSELLEDG
jgi:hypothetical protein